MPPIVPGAPIPNFREVYPWLYRGGQPSIEGIKYLSDRKIRTIISLRWSRSVIAIEKKAMESLGIRFVSIRLNYWTFPSMEQIDQFLDIVDDESQRPVYIHCKHGSDRTGIFLAAYRMAREGWSADEAYQEMKECGFHLIRMYHFKWAVYLFARELARREHSGIS